MPVMKHITGDAVENALKRKQSRMVRPFSVEQNKKLRQPLKFKIKK